MLKDNTAKRIQTFLQLRLQKEGTINAMMNMKLESVDEEKRKIILSFPVEKWQLNPVGHMHGGLISTAMDITMGCVAYTFSKADFTPTIQLSVNFVNAIKEGDTLYLEGVCDHGGSRMAQTRAVARTNHKDEVVASANGSYAINTKQ
ncbi:MAG: PaaI family thioesterase [Longicatena sp.]